MKLQSTKLTLILKYVTSGFSVALFQLLTFLFLLEVINMGYLISSALAFLLTIVTSFIIQRTFVFQVNGRRAVDAKTAFVATSLNSFLGLGVNCFIMYAGVEYVYKSVIFWQIISMIAVSVYNFFFYRYMFRPLYT